MNINLGKYYSHKLERLVTLGVASNKTEALRLAILSFERQIGEEEANMVLERISEDKTRWKQANTRTKFRKFLSELEYRNSNTKAKFKNFDEILAENKILSELK